MLETIYKFTDDINSIVFDQSAILIRTLNEHDKLYLLTYDGTEYVKQPRVLNLETVQLYCLKDDQIFFKDYDGNGLKVAQISKSSSDDDEKVWSIDESKVKKMALEVKKVITVG